MIIDKLIESRVEQALTSVRPHLKVDGGDVELVEITENGLVKVRWIGNCVNCSLSPLTLKAGIEQSIKMHWPEMTGIEAVV